MANNTEDVELRDRLKSILDNFYYTIDEDMGQADDTAIYSLSALVQQEANRQKLELLDELNKTIGKARRDTNDIRSWEDGHRKRGYNEAINDFELTIKAECKKLEEDKL